MVSQGRVNWRVLVTAALVLALAAASGARLGTGHAQAPPALPTIVTGTAAIDGRPAPAGTTVTALIASNNCGDKAVQPDGTYVVQVGGRPGNAPACDQLGATIEFAIGNQAATGTTTRELGQLKQVNLTATTQTIAVPTPLPTVTPPPAGAAQPVVTPPPAVLAPGATPPQVVQAQPQAPQQAEKEDGGGFAWWPLVVAGAALAGVAILLSRRRAGS